MNARHARTLGIGLALAVAACGGGDGGEEMDRGAPPPGAEAEAEQVRLVAGSRSQQAFAGAAASIESPAAGATVEPGTLAVRLGIEAFELGAETPGAADRGIAVSDGGQHIHLILDDRPYEAVYATDEAVELRDVGPGRHVLFAFPSRAWHESVKAAGALAVRPFVVRGAPGEAAEAEPAAGFDPDAPFLVYSRPKGTYAGADADSVMVDFYLGNVDLESDPYRVRLSLDGNVEGELDRWAPWYLLGLSDGEHEVVLELVTLAGEPVPGPFTRTTRTIRVERQGERTGG